MSTDRPSTSPGSGRGADDIVGARVLVGTQMLDISRLSTHPLPMISQGLITVAGQGPKDSNGAGKSSFIAGLSLLHADDQWKLASGAAGAADLLFTAELAAQETRYSNADHGYIIGVFADPGAITIADLQASALTVWLRINRKAPYLDLRWQEGLYLPNGSSEPQRASQADPMWQALPMSNGRTDFHASRLSSVLFGGHARCVSFLSTSVRSSPTPNLLAQPLNDLSPARIFDAIANLTGLDRELEQEQALRGKEHAHRVQVREAERDLETWEGEITVVEAGIAQRREARDHLGAARVAWNSRCARHLIDGLERAEEIRAELGELDGQAERLGAELAAVSAQVGAISDDREFARRFTEAKQHRDELAERDRTLDTEHQVTARELDELGTRHRDLAETARGADGRSAETAGQELDSAREEFELTLGAHGAAQAAEQQARDLVDAAESGQDLAVAQLRLLGKAGVPAAALLDVISLDAAQRAEWESRLALYREAAVVHRAQADTAREVLADLPGSTLILADEGPARTTKTASGAEATGAASATGPARRTKTASGVEAAGMTRPADGTETASGAEAAGAASATGPAKAPGRGQPEGPGSLAGLPGSADTRFDLTAFLSAIGRRAHRSEEITDAEAGVLVLGGFAEALTGQAARIAAARQVHQGKSELLAEAKGRLAAARTGVGRAEARARAAAAAEQAGQIQEKMTELRQQNAARAEQREALKPSLAAAEEAYADALGARHARDEKLANLRGSRGRILGSQKANQDAKARLTDERDALGLLEREAAWGDSDDAARRHLLTLDDAQQRRTAAEWNEEACHALADVVRRCFPDPAPPEEMPAEARELLIGQNWQRGGLEVRVRLAPALLRALRTHLNLTEEHDSYQQKQISTQRTERTGDLAAARLGLAESEQTCHAHRASLARGIKNTLRQVAEAFDELDQAYGGYGAGLDYPEPEPPSEPDRPWQWTVAPKWRRAEGQRMGGYNLKANTAQIDEKAAKLVCAAAQAASGDRPLVLILDELGRNLGKQHRREAVALFERIGRDRNITVVGALQDDMERYAIEASGLYVKLRRSSDAIAYNEAPVIAGDEANRPRVELLQQWLTSHRPPSGEGTQDSGPGDQPYSQLDGFDVDRDHSAGLS